MSASRRTLTVFSAAAAIAAGAAVAAPANAATLTVPPCVVDYGLSQLQNLKIAGTGFAPGSSVGILSATAANPTPGTAAGATVDAAGNFLAERGPLSFNRFDTVDETFTIVATDRTNPAITASAQLRQVRFGFNAKPDTGRPSRPTRYTARGFAPGQPVYAHFRFGGKTRRDVKLGVAAAPCGTASKRMRLLPVSKTRFGTWTVYMDQVPTYSPETEKTGLSAKGELTIRRVFR